MSRLNRVSRFVAIAFALLALVSGIVLLIRDAGAAALQAVPISTISAAPLLLVGVGFLIFQAASHPTKLELLKNALLAATFLLWGVVQLIPQNALAARLGDLVIVLYVVDLAWAILIKPNPARSDHASRGFD